MIPQPFPCLLFTNIFLFLINLHLPVLAAAPDSAFHFFFTVFPLTFILSTSPLLNRYSHYLPIIVLYMELYCIWNLSGLLFYYWQLLTIYTYLLYNLYFYNNMSLRLFMFGCIFTQPLISYTLICFPSLFSQISCPRCSSRQIRAYLRPFSISILYCLPLIINSYFLKYL